MHFELQGQGHPVVLMAGLGGLGAFWRPVMERLSRQHLCITFDHPGMGRSPPAAEHSIGHIATEVLGLLEQLKLPSAHFVGHSTGGLVAQVLALDHPQRVDRNASLASPHVQAYGAALLAELADRYPGVHGLRIDWPEYPP